VLALALTPTGGELAVGGDGRNLVFWDVKKGKKPRLFDTRLDLTKSLAFSPDGKELAVGGYYLETGAPALELREVKTGKVLRSFGGHSRGVEGVAFSPDLYFARTAHTISPLIDL
jgi:WD40 repeat protein